MRGLVFLLLLTATAWAQAPDATIGRLMPGMTEHAVLSIQGPPARRENFSGRPAFSYLNPRDPRLVRIRVLFRDNLVSSIWGQSLEVGADLLVTGDTQSRVETVLGPPDTAFEHYVSGSRALERVLHYRTLGHYLTVFLQEGVVRSFRTARAPWRYGSGGSTD